RAALNPAATASTASEGIAEAEELAEDFAKILERCRVETATSTGCGAHSSVAETVIEGPLLRIGQDCVGFRDFLEAFFGVGVIGVAIGMVLHGELAISTLQLAIARRTGYG